MGGLSQSSPVTDKIAEKSKFASAADAGRHLDAVLDSILAVLVLRQATLRVSEDRVYLPARTAATQQKPDLP